MRRTAALRNLPRARGKAVLRKAAPENRRRLPLLRSECIDLPRPCPFVSCRFHLYLDVSNGGGITINFPGLPVEALAESCALDVAERGESTLEEVGVCLNLTRVAVHEIETLALDKLRPFFGGAS